MQNPWTITIIGGLIIVFISYVFRNMFKKDSGNPQNQSQKFEINNTINNNLLPSTDQSQPLNIPELKIKTNILFIDDQVFKKVDNLEMAGWKNITQITTVSNIDIPEIIEADIVFVDYKGVGKNYSNEQGVGVIKALKDRYKNKKWVILYSAHSFDLDVFSTGADSYLGKNSNVYEFEQKIIEGAKKIIK